MDQVDDRWVRLAAGYYHDPRIVRAGPTAEVVYVRLLATARQLGTDGHIATEQRHLLGQGLGRGVLGRAIAALIREELIEQCADGIRVPPARWARWQQTNGERAARAARERERKAEYRRRLREQGALFDEP